LCLLFAIYPSLIRSAGYRKNEFYHFYYLGVVMKKLLFAILLLMHVKLLGQPWTYNLGTSTGTYNTAGGTSTTFLPAPTNGTSFVRIGNGAGSINMEGSGTGIQKIGSGSRLRIVAPTGTSINKASIYSYTGGTSFYTKFSILLGGSDGANVSTGTFYFFQGAGATYSNANGFSGTEVFTGLRFAFGASGAITTDYRNSGAWSALGSTPISQGNVYIVEIFGNNTAGSVNYTYNGASQTTASGTQDIWIN
jgi:hypothetical protein